MDLRGIGDPDALGRRAAGSLQKNSAASIPRCPVPRCPIRPSPIRPRPIPPSPIPPAPPPATISADPHRVRRSHGTIDLVPSPGNPGRNSSNGAGRRCALSAPQPERTIRTADVRQPGSLALRRDGRCGTRPPSHDTRLAKPTDAGAGRTSGIAVPLHRPRGRVRNTQSPHLMTHRRWWRRCVRTPIQSEVVGAAGRAANGEGISRPRTGTKSSPPVRSTRKCPPRAVRYRRSARLC